MKRIIMAVSAAIITAFTAATPASTAQGGEIRWIEWNISQDLLNQIDHRAKQENLGEFFGATLYMISFANLSDVRAELYDENPTFDEKWASSSLALKAWDLSDATPSVESLTDGNAVIDEALIPPEFILFLLLRFEEGVIVGFNPNDHTISWGNGPDYDDFYTVESEDPEWPDVSYITPITIIPLPEPATGLLVLGGAAVVLLRRRRR